MLLLDQALDEDPKFYKAVLSTEGLLQVHLDLLKVSVPETEACILLYF